MLEAMTVMATIVRTRPAVTRIRQETESESAPVWLAAGRYVSPLSAAFKAEMLPTTVKEAEPFAPPVKLESVHVLANVSVPCATVSVSESVVAAAAASVTLIALPIPVEKTNEPFSNALAVDDARNRGRRSGPRSARRGPKSTGRLPNR